MTGYFVSLLMGLVVGVAYALVQVRSPAPPPIAPVGLLAMVLGEKVVDIAKRHLPSQVVTREGHAFEAQSLAAMQSGSRAQRGGAPGWRTQAHRKARGASGRDRLLRPA